MLLTTYLQTHITQYQLVESALNLVQAIGVLDTQPPMPLFI